jgi:NAD(P)-dependent dehydrogenase (short-subunit alcohol dehydrogenase family)
MTTTRIALVTGANRGIGLEIARQLARAGLIVVLGARDPDTGAAAQRALSGEGLDADLVELDVTYSASISAAMAHIDEVFGRLDVLVNNAGILLDRGADGRMMTVPDVTMDVVKATFDTNVFGALRMMQAAIPRMRANDYGRIVNVSSELGQMAQMGGGRPAYRASKAALNAFTRTAAADLAETGIKVNAMAPGWVQTDMGGAEAERPVEEGADTAVWLSMLADDGPTGGFFMDRKPIPW